MADFSALCPLFNTGVYKELTLPNISVSTSAWVAGAALSATAPCFSWGPWSRSVTITRVLVHTTADYSTTSQIKLIFARGASMSAAHTAFASIVISGTNICRKVYVATVGAAKNLNAADYLLVFRAAKENSAPPVNIFVRFKDR